MIFVEVECDRDGCPNGSELVDVYHQDWRLGIPVSSYLPPDWTVLGGDEAGLPIVHCPDCSAAT